MGRDPSGRPVKAVTSSNLPSGGKEDLKITGVAKLRRHPVIATERQVGSRSKHHEPGGTDQQSDLPIRPADAAFPYGQATGHLGTCSRIVLTGALASVLISLSCVPRLPL